jgi:NAD(P)H dehydrogenase (quinone)
VAETLPEEVLKKMHAPPKNAAIPVIQVQQLTEADGFLFGFPTRYGMMASQFKSFFDSTGGLWRTQALAGKPAGFFVSTGTQGGGQETTAYAYNTLCIAIPSVIHEGVYYVHFSCNIWVILS